MRTMTHRQAERQRVRKQGRYSKMLACYACKKSIKGELYTHVSDDKNLQAAAVLAGLPEVCIVCHDCAGRLA